MNVTAIIPSRTPANLDVCLAALAALDPEVNVIVVDDGLGKWWLSEDASKRFDGSGPMFMVVKGEKPFIYARNVNIGIQIARRCFEPAHTGGVVLLNDDAVLETRQGFSGLAYMASHYPFTGIMAAATNVTGYPVQLRQPGGHVRPADVVAFIAVYLPWRTIGQVGLLDERFNAYGGDDVDYCWRVKQAGLAVRVWDGCFVDHDRLPSTFRPGGGGGNISVSNQQLRQKWGRAISST